MNISPSKLISLLFFIFSGFFLYTAHQIEVFAFDDKGIHNIRQHRIQAHFFYADIMLSTAILLISYWTCTRDLDESSALLSKSIDQHCSDGCKQVYCDSSSSSEGMGGDCVEGNDNDYRKISKFQGWKTSIEFDEGSSYFISGRKSFMDLLMGRTEKWSKTLYQNRSSQMDNFDYGIASCDYGPTCTAGLRTALGSCHLSNRLRHTMSLQVVYFIQISSTVRH